MQARAVARSLYVTCQSFLLLAFAFPAIRSLITGERLEEIVGRLGVHLIGCALVSLVIAAGIELSYAFHLRRTASKRSARAGGGAREPSDL